MTRYRLRERSSSPLPNMKRLNAPLDKNVTMHAGMFTDVRLYQ
jgi:hypothetical protein